MISEKSRNKILRLTWHAMLSLVFIAFYMVNISDIYGYQWHYSSVYSSEVVEYGDIDEIRLDIVVLPTVVSLQLPVESSCDTISVLQLSPVIFQPPETT